MGLIHVDAHADTSDVILGEKIGHGTPFRRCVEEGLLDCKRVVQIGLRGTGYSADSYEWSRAQVPVIDYQSGDDSELINNRTVPYWNAAAVSWLCLVFLHICSLRRDSVWCKWKNVGSNPSLLLWLRSGLRWAAVQCISVSTSTLLTQALPLEQEHQR